MNSMARAPSARKLPPVSRRLITLQASIGPVSRPNPRSCPGKRQDGPLPWPGARQANSQRAGLFNSTFRPTEGGLLLDNQGCLSGYTFECTGGSSES